MHDAPLISPENKDSAPELIARLPKVELDAVFAPESLPADNAALTAAMREYVQELAAANVVYAEIRFDPQAFAFGAEAALEAATAGLDVSGIDARLLLTNAPQSASARLGSQVVGFVLEGESDPQVAADLRANFVPFVVDVRGLEFEAVAAAVQSGATRLAHATQLPDDFSADLEGIQPGTVSSWVRDRHLAATFEPLSFEEFSDHPLPLLQQLGFTCAVTAGSGNLNEVFLALTEYFGYGLEEFFDLSVKALENSFSTEEERQHLLETVILPTYEELSDPELAGPDTEESVAAE
ncbi:adenosine deaminase [uncultured Corynebacterium sp.]|uniref:adenosine deaminase n=1 Tax=uncultured Corynebacterium sp. TaxID=159447 RepID=UPI00288A3401|nr:adenosine deaminase [uncultured Corynebacterium sp.]